MPRLKETKHIPSGHPKSIGDLKNLAEEEVHRSVNLDSLRMHWTSRLEPTTARLRGGETR